MSRLERNECLKCGTPLVRIDGVPCCSKCWEQIGRDLRNGKYKAKTPMRWKREGKNIKIAKDKRRAANR